MADFEITDATERNLARFGGDKRRYERARARAVRLFERSERVRREHGFGPFWNPPLYRLARCGRPALGSARLGCDVGERMG